jgi:hypothetical protein
MNNEENINNPKETAEGPSKSQVQKIEVNRKRASEELISMIRDLGSSCVKVKNLVKNIKKKGHEEEFSNFEINLLAREVLRQSLTKRQLNYWFPIRKNTTDTTEESSSHCAQIVNNDSKKVTEKSNILGQMKGGSDTDVLLQSTVSGPDPEAKMLDSNSTTNAFPIIESKNRTARSSSYFNLADFDSIDCTNHPMYQRAHEKIEQLTQALTEKREERMKVKEEILHKT